MTPAGQLTESTSLAQAQAQQIVRDITGFSEIEYETHKADRLDRRRAHRPDLTDLTDLAGIDRHAAEARQRGADFISVRRLSELLGATTLNTFADLSDLLATHRAHAYAPSIYRTEAAL